MLGGQQKVDRLAFLVHGPIEVLPSAFDLDVSLVHAPAAANRALVFAEHFLKQGHKPDRPAVDGGMIDTNATLLHHFFQVAVAERIGCIPADAHQNPSQLGVALL